MRTSHIRLLIITIIFSSTNLIGQTSFDLFLIGDAGENTEPGPTLIYLQKELLKNPNSTVVFLGDNIYDNGLRTDKNKTYNEKDEKRLRSQLDILSGYLGTAYFIPGNHDWHNGKIKGPKILKNEEVYIDQYFLQNNINGGFYPKGGLPGPYSFLISPGIKLIIIDTQWWLHKTSILHKTNNGGQTRKQVKKQFIKDLRFELSMASKKNEIVVIAAHHPFYTSGSHGSKNQPWRFINNNTPFQILGQLGLNRKFVQDTPQPKYQRLLQLLKSEFKYYNNIIHVSGHDHNLQLIENEDITFIVSGAGSKKTNLKLSQLPGLIFSSDKETGLVKIHFEDGQPEYIDFINGESQKSLYRHH